MPDLTACEWFATGTVIMVGVPDGSGDYRNYDSIPVAIAIDPSMADCIVESHNDDLKRRGE